MSTYATVAMKRDTDTAEILQKHNRHQQGRAATRTLFFLHAKSRVRTEISSGLRRRSNVRARCTWIAGERMSRPAGSSRIAQKEQKHPCPPEALPIRTR
ncbi:hypothetical protein NDU88_007430 [Pleurodeles waltl]|uniref:Uncharacterized protein n=1 Tax=Pleurodeles waltl TaxID=8319 RepID=A0AAV7RSE4_PLEWA|nr:hypothetical protein NDU88_007430 [Pleurodeles waltl]